MVSCMQNTGERLLGYAQSPPCDVRARYDKKISVIGVPAEGDYWRERMAYPELTYIDVWEWLVMR